MSDNAKSEVKRLTVSISVNIRDEYYQPVASATHEGMRLVLPHAAIHSLENAIDEVWAGVRSDAIRSALRCEFVAKFGRPFERVEAVDEAEVIEP